MVLGEHEILKNTSTEMIAWLASQLCPGFPHPAPPAAALPYIS